MKYFCCCHECGSSEWLEFFDEDGQNIANSLNSEGDVTVKNVMQKYIWQGSHILCAICEEQLRIIPFKEVSKSMRMRLYKMSDEERARWARSYLTTKKLLNDENSENDEGSY